MITPAVIALYDITESLRFHLSDLLPQELLDIVGFAKFMLVFSPHLGGAVLFPLTKLGEARQHTIYI